MPFLALLISLFSLVARAEDAATGILKVKASAEAQVFLDGALIGATPITKYVPVGPHKIRVVADRFDPWVRAVTVEADKTVDLTATLVAGAGTIEFTGPKGASVAFGGQTYPLPTRIPPPRPGKHDYVATAPGHEDTAGTIEFAAGKNYLIDVKLESSAGVFRVETTPAGGKVWLDGAEVGVAPWSAKGIPLGKHGVAVHLDGYASVYRTVDTTAGNRGEVKAGMPKTGATLVITTGGPDAQVFLNESPAGTGATVQVGPVERGRARLRVVQGGKTVETTMTLPASGTLAVRVAGDQIIERRPLTQRWGFWAAIAGGAAVAGGTAIAIAVANQPEPPPTGDTVVTLP